MKTTLKKFGFYAGISAALLFLSALYFGRNLSYGTQEILGYLTIVISLIFVFFGVKHFRDHQNNGSISFSKALQLGVLIALFAAMGIAIVDYIYCTVINPDFVKAYIEETQTEQHPNTISVLFALLMFATVLIIGFIISLLSAIILQSKN